LRGSVSLWRRLLLAHSLILLDDFDDFLFWHFDQLLFSARYGCLFRLNDFS
jgi:hypothetical protein